MVVVAKSGVSVKKKALLEQLARVKAAKVSKMSLREEYIRTHRWEYFKPYTWQEWLPDRIREKLIVLAPAPNGIGKSVAAICILASWVMGYEAWNPVEVGYPGAVGVGERWFKGSSLGVVPPVDIRVTGEDWNHHLNRVVVKAMREWFPCGEFRVKKNTNGVEYFWTHVGNGSTIELMTHGMDVKQYEGWRGHGWIPDEPPPYSIFKPMARGLAENRGKILIPSTPLREAWMLDELILTNRSDVAVVRDLTLYDNEGSYGSDNAVLEELGLQGKCTRYYRESDGKKKEFFDLILYRDDFGVAAEAYLRENASGDIDSRINELIFLKKARDTALDEKPSRFFGVFKQLIGLVVKEFSKDRHIVSGEGEIPVDWIITPFIDFHLGKPQAISFYACSKQNIHYVIDEVWENMPPEEIADLIVRRKKLKGWNINEVFIDPLSKGDDKYMKNRFAGVEDSFSIIESRLLDEGIVLEVASKDKVSGFTNIKSWLEGPNRIPMLYFFDTLQSVAVSNGYGHVFEIQRLCYDDNGKPENKNDHFMENLYRYTLAGVEYDNNKDDAVLVAGNNGGGGWLGN